jgi:5-methylcytosine-specific restriction endonuclease McrA
MRANALLRCAGPDAMPARGHVRRRSAEVVPEAVGTGTGVGHGGRPSRLPADSHRRQKAGYLPQGVAASCPKLPTAKRTMSRRRAREVKVTYADGTTERVAPGHFRKKRKRRKTKAQRLSAYERYLRSSHWRQRRQAILIRDVVCRACGSSVNLQVHHLSYERLGAERDEDLVTLCRDCHRRTHRRGA